MATIRNLSLVNFVLQKNARDHSNLKLFNVLYSLQLIYYNKFLNKQLLVLINIITSTETYITYSQKQKNQTCLYVCIISSMLLKLKTMVKYTTY